MTLSSAIVVLLLCAVLAANFPWLSNRPFFVMPELKHGKSAWFRLLEWVANYFIVIFLGIGMERKLNGVIHSQQWEFWAVTALFFAVLAMPGFIYRYDLSRYLKRYKKQKAILEN